MAARRAGAPPAEVDPGNTIGRMWQYQIVRLFISDDNKHVYLNEMDGPTRGTLFYMQPRASNGEVTLKFVLAQRARPGVAAIRSGSRNQPMQRTRSGR
jgi:hypothetical protein